MTIGNGDQWGETICGDSANSKTHVTSVSHTRSKDTHASAIEWIKKEAKRVVFDSASGFYRRSSKVQETPIAIWDVADLMKAG